MHLPAFIRRHCTDECILGILLSVCAIASTQYFYSVDWLLGDYDAVANLNIARLVTESVTPGISQLGVWNMLIHIVLIPATMSDPLYRSGMAGFVTLLPFTFLGVAFLFRTVRTLTNRRSLGYLATLLFMLNPYVLFYTAAPMSEMLLIVSLLGIAYYYVRWSLHDRTSDLLFFAGFIALAATARLEGFILFPVGFVVLFLHQVLHRVPWRRMLGDLMLFSVLGSVGWVFIMLYSWVYTGNPVFFVSYSPIGETQLIPGQKPEVRLILMKIWYAISNMISPTLILATGILAPLAPFLAKRTIRLSVVGVLLLLVATPAFVLVTVYTGARPLEVPELGKPYNVRYMLQFMPFCIIACMSALSGIMGTARGFLLRAARRFVACVAVLYFIFSIVFQAYSVFVVRRLDGVPHASEHSIPPKKKLENFFLYYDHGRVLTTHYNNVALMYHSYLPLDRFIYESNYRYYKQAAREPWLFVRWVAKNMRDNSYTTLIRTEDEQFQYYYELVAVLSLGEGDVQLYRLREDRVRGIARLLGGNPLLIPSLQTDDSVLWDPVTIYRTLRSSMPVPGTP